MTFAQMLATFIGRSAEVMVPNQIFDGTLINVTATELSLRSTSPVYGPTPTQIVVPLINIDFVRILA
jgi:hypothetical protein